MTWCLISKLDDLSTEIFKLMNDVENEDLVLCLETIFVKFGEEMAPYAVGLCQNLVYCKLESSDNFLTFSFTMHLTSPPFCL